MRRCRVSTSVSPEVVVNIDLFPSLDLTVASRAYLMEPHWNPSVEQQALARIYRMGQMRPVTTVRFVMRDSFEEVCMATTFC
jgi:hypothetical protein